VITDHAVESAVDYPACKCLDEAWETLYYMNEVLYRLKFVDNQRELVQSFQNETGYELAMTEGANTKKDRKLMDRRKLLHDGREYDITPHLKQGNQEPKLVRIYFAFDEEAKKIVIGHIGKHIPNATSKSL
jgi:hypothetical protein